MVVYTNARTLLAVVTTGRAIRTTLPAFRERLPKLLARLGLAPEWIREQTAALEPVHFARTNDRRVLGSMNDQASAIQVEIQHFGYAWFTPDRMELRLADTPMSVLAHHNAALVTRALALGKEPDVLRDELIAERQRSASAE